MPELVCPKCRLTLRTQERYDTHVAECEHDVSVEPGQTIWATSSLAGGTRKRGTK